MGDSIPLLSQHPSLHHDVDLIIASISLPIAISNIHYGIVTVIHNKHAIYKLNLLAAVLLLVNSVVQMVGTLPSNIPCMARYLVYAVSSYISLVSLDTILYLKAKSVRPKARLITTVYILFRLLHLGIWVKLIYGVNLIYVGPGTHSCTSIAKFYDMLILIGLETTIIIYLTITFLKIIYSQYKEAPRAIYSLLLKDGLIFSLSICVFYFFITILKFAKIMAHTDLFSIEWVVSSKLMTEQVWRSHMWRSERQNLEETTVMEDFEHNNGAVAIDFDEVSSAK
ncbi:hypothetical protein K7432_007572 [Basidiobolus ranarum]|uniref:Uncharacterized protein n=1 Tax=Basidiobolus ranarum TaxID=34480 RepID=A0ABR2W0C8_9FUNG